MLCSISQLQFLWLDWRWTFSFLVLDSKKSWYYHIYIYVCVCVCVCKYICILLYINMVLLHIYVILLSFINLKEKNHQLSILTHSPSSPLRLTESPLFPLSSGLSSPPGFSSLLSDLIQICVPDGIFTSPWALLSESSPPGRTLILTDYWTV